MRCSDARYRASVSLDGVVDAALEEHLDGCPACREHRAAMQAVKDGLALDRRDVAPDLAPRIMAAVGAAPVRAVPDAAVSSHGEPTASADELAAPAALPTTDVASLRARRRRRWAVPAVAAAVAAALVLGVLVFVDDGRDGAPVADSTPSSAPVTTPSTAPPASTTPSTAAPTTLTLADGTDGAPVPAVVRIAIGAPVIGARTESVDVCGTRTAVLDRFAAVAPGVPVDEAALVAGGTVGAVGAGYTAVFTGVVGYCDAVWDDAAWQACGSDVLVVDSPEAFAALDGTSSVGCGVRWTWLTPVPAAAWAAVDQGDVWVAYPVTNPNGIRVARPADAGGAVRWFDGAGGLLGEGRA